MNCILMSNNKELLIVLDELRNILMKKRNDGLATTISAGFKSTTHYPLQL